MKRRDSDFCDLCDADLDEDDGGFTCLLCGCRYCHNCSGGYGTCVDCQSDDDEDVEEANDEKA